MVAKTKPKKKATRKKPVVTKLKRRTPVNRFKELRSIRIFDFHIIPKYLFEQIKGANWTTEALLQLNDPIHSSPFSFLFVFVDSENIIKGFLWGSLNPASLIFEAFAFSMDKEYWNAGSLAGVKEFLANLIKDLGIKKVTFTTTRPRAMEKAGFVRDKAILMKFEPKELLEE